MHSPLQVYSPFCTILEPIVLTVNDHDLGLSLVGAQNLTINLPICLAYLATRIHDFILAVESYLRAWRIKKQVWGCL